MDARFSVLQSIEMITEVPTHTSRWGDILDSRLHDSPISLYKQIVFKFTKGTVKALLSPDGPVFYYPFLPDKDSLSYSQQQENLRLIEQSVRTFLTEIKSMTCYQDCGSVGLCQECSRWYKEAVPFWIEDPIDRYHLSGECREATDAELKSIMDMVWIDNWMCPGIWDQIPEYLLAYGLKAEDGRIEDAKERCIVSHAHRTM
jgi:hypothetical protein